MSTYERAIVETNGILTSRVTVKWYGVKRPHTHHIKIIDGHIDRKKGA